MGRLLRLVISDPQIGSAISVLGLTNVLNVHEKMEAVIHDARGGADAA
jgi:hypothetical protein